MNDELRTGVAYIAARLIAGVSASAVYDYAAGRSFQLSGDASGQRVNVYDDERGCFLGGTPKSLFDFGTNNHFDLEVVGDRFKGYDYASNQFFEGTVRGGAISLFDYATSRHHEYSI